MLQVVAYKPRSSRPVVSTHSTWLSGL